MTALAREPAAPAPARRPWRRLDNGVEIAAVSRPRGAYRHHVATVDGAVVAMLRSRPGGRGCGGVAAVDAHIAGRSVPCTGVREWVALLDAAPTQLLLLRPSYTGSWSKSDRLARWPPQTERYRERVRFRARAKVLAVQLALGRDTAATRQLHEHPIARALRRAAGDVDPWLSPAPRDRLTVAVELADATWDVYGTAPEIRESLADLERRLPPTADAVDLVVALIYQHAGCLESTQGELFDATA